MIQSQGCSGRTDNPRPRDVEKLRCSARKETPVTVNIATMISVTAYLENEKVSDLRSEYIDGLCLPMIGAGRAHDLLCARLSRLLRQGVAATGCRLYRASFKVRIRAADGERFYYPDLQVACDKTLEQPDFLEHPKLVVEVLSPVSEQRDRDVKASDYQQIDSLQELILVCDAVDHIEIRRRATQWACETYRSGDRFRLESIGEGLAVDDIYEVLSTRPSPRAAAAPGDSVIRSALRATG